MVEYPYPLRIYVGPHNELITFHDKLMKPLQRFELYASEQGVVVSRYDCCAVFPQFERIETGKYNLASNTDFPLRIYAQDTDIMFYFHGRPIKNNLKQLHITLGAAIKRCISIILRAPELPEEVTDALVMLGCEVILDV